MVLGIVIVSITAFIALMVGIMVVQQTDTAAAAIIPNDTGSANTTYTSLVTAVWNAFGLYNVYPIILAAVGIIAIVSYLAYARAAT